MHLHGCVSLIVISPTKANLSLHQQSVATAYSVVKVLGSRSPSVIPLYTLVDWFEEMSGQLAEWHSAKASSCIQLSLSL